MKALVIKPHSREIELIDLQMKADMLYSFFASILIDELDPIKEHVIYSDANALSEKKEPFFLGERLIIGDALVFGRSDFDELDVKITQGELLKLIRYEVNDFYKRVLNLLADSDINLYRTFELEKGAQKLALSTEWVLYTFNIADERTQEYFIGELQKVLDAKENVESYMQKMAQLALNAAD